MELYDRKYIMESLMTEIQKKCANTECYNIPSLNYLLCEKCSNTVTECQNTNCHNKKEIHHLLCDKCHKDTKLVGNDMNNKTIKYKGRHLVIVKCPIRGCNVSNIRNEFKLQICKDH